MDVQIGEVNTTLRMMDSQTLLSPQLMEQIVRTVMLRLRDEQERTRALEEGRSLRPAASARPSEQWTTS